MSEAQHWAEPQRFLESTAVHLGGWRFSFAGEADLQEGIGRALAGFCDVQREAHLGQGERIDYLLRRQGVVLGLEIKTAGSAATVLHQLMRYAEYPQVHGLVLVTSRSRHRSMPNEVRGKPLRVVYVGQVA